MIKYTMIVSDVDGTLFQKDNKLDPVTVELVRKFHNSGGIFTLATGRMKKSIEPFIQTLQIGFPVIVYNGAQIIDPVTNQVLTAHTLDRELAREALRLLKRFPLDLIMHVNQQPYVRGYSEAVVDHMKKDGIHCHVTKEFDELIEAPPTKMLIIGNPNLLQQFADQLIANVGYDFHPVYSSWNYLEILPADATKGNALKTLSTIRGIPLERIVAIGDERNDVSMLKAAGLGVAVANANEEVIHQADRVTTGSWNKGLEEVIREIILSNQAAQ